MCKAVKIKMFGKAPEKAERKGTCECQQKKGQSALNLRDF